MPHRKLYAMATGLLALAILVAAAGAATGPAIIRITDVEVSLRTVNLQTEPSAARCR